MIVLNIEGDELSTRWQALLEKLLADRGDAEEQMSGIFSMAHFFEHERCCDGKGVPRRPASGQARLRAHVELSREWLSPARGIS